jgi:hypothetical protein
MTTVTRGSADGRIRATVAACPASMKPGLCASPGRAIVAVLDTHLQADHVSGLPDLVSRTEAPLTYPSVEFEHRALRDSEAITLGNTEIKALATPATRRLSAPRLEYFPRWICGLLEGYAAAYPKLESRAGLNVTGPCSDRPERRGLHPNVCCDLIDVDRRTLPHPFGRAHLLER